MDFSKTTGLTEGEKEYYEKQLDTLKSFGEVDSMVSDSRSVNDHEQALKEEGQHETAIIISNLANIFLLQFKIYAMVESASLAVGASTLDSLLDIAARGILWITHWFMKSINFNKYPIGKLRVQSVGIIIFATVMVTLEPYLDPDIFGMPLITRVATALACVGPLVSLATLHDTSLGSSGSKIVREYAKDHYFDVVTNVVGLAAAVLGDRFYWWIDPVGAAALAVYTILNWSGNILETAVSLVGQTAPPEMLKKLTYLVLRHHPTIKRVDTVRAYTFEVPSFVEDDIELPEDLSLQEAHAIGESLQKKIEQLPEVEHAFVHLDYGCDHKPEHSVLKRLPYSQP
ncbi:hypothetical protein LguiB_017784 [Lonicera macranthoides]